MLCIVLRRLLSYKRRRPISFSLLEINEKTGLKTSCSCIFFLSECLAIFQGFR
jgi:hypothetical protein